MYVFRLICYYEFIYISTLPFAKYSSTSPKAAYNKLRKAQIKFSRQLFKRHKLVFRDGSLLDVQTEFKDYLGDSKAQGSYAYTQIISLKKDSQL